MFPKKFLKQFTTNDKAFLLDDTIFVKGEESKVLQIDVVNIGSIDEQYQMNTKKEAIQLKNKLESIINVGSNFYRNQITCVKVDE